MVPAAMRLVGALIVAGREDGDVPVELLPQPTSARATIMSIERRNRFGLIGSPQTLNPDAIVSPNRLAGGARVATQGGGQACSPATTVARRGASSRSEERRVGKE